MIGAPYGVRRMRRARSARRVWCVALVAGVAVACRGARDAATTAAGAPGAGPMTTSARDTGRDCGLVRVNAYPDPGVLVQTYVQRDGAGEFVQHTAWLDTAYECPHQLPAGRPFAVVAFRAAVAPLDHADSSARYTVQSEQLGVVTPDTGGAGYVVQRDTKVDTAVVVRTAFGWRLVAPMPPTNVVAAEILSARLQALLKPGARTALARGWAEAVGGAGK
jgi:hypothetical protein